MDDAAQRAQALLDSLRRLPPFAGVVFRGVGEVPEAERPRALTRVTPTSSSVRIATENFQAPVIAAIVTRTARDLQRFSQRPDEGEILLLPGSRLRTLVVGSVGADATPLVLLEELDDDPDAPLPHSVEELLIAITGRIADARRADPVVVRSPGKFAGALDLE